MYVPIVDFLAEWLRSLGRHSANLFVDKKDVDIKGNMKTFEYTAISGPLVLSTTLKCRLS